MSHTSIISCGDIYDVAFCDKFLSVGLCQIYE